MRIGKSWTGSYWKHGELTRVAKVARMNVSRVRTGKQKISQSQARVIVLACLSIGKTDLTAKDWLKASIGQSDHPAFEEVYKSSKLWGKHWD